MRVIHKRNQHKCHMGSSPHQILSRLFLPGCASLALAGAATVLYNSQTQTALAKEVNRDSLFTVEVTPNLSITIPKSATLSLKSSQAGTFGSTDLTATVDTSDGYTLSMYATSPLTDEATRTTSLVNTTPGLSAKIGTIPAIISEDLFKRKTEYNNQWGYSLNRSQDSGATTYNPITTDAMTIGHSIMGGSFNNTITFGAKVDDSLPSGSYSTVLNFIAVVNVRTMTDINNILYMQDLARLTEEQKRLVLDSMVPEQQYILTDERDNKDYYISKLKDGHVWMTQNLDFDITEETAKYLTSEYTNLTVGSGTIYESGYEMDENGIITWVPVATAYTTKTGRNMTGTNGEINYGSNVNKWIINDTMPYSVDVGDWYETGTYFASSVCNDASWSVGCNFLNSAKTTVQDGITLLDNYWSTKAFSKNGTHGAVGNYYNWSVAVASNSTSNTSAGETANSICPAGWGLPNIAEYANLNNVYNPGFTAGNSRDAGLMAAPWYGVRGGVVYTDNGLTTLYATGRNGDYWSSTASDATMSYHFYFRSSEVNPAYSVTHGYGYTLRCIAL